MLLLAFILAINIRYSFVNIGVGWGSMVGCNWRTSPLGFWYPVHFVSEF